VAGIKIWMLTGDKLETAENIAFSCNLINENFEIYKIQTFRDCDRFCCQQAVRKNQRLKNLGIKRGIIIEATALKKILSDQEMTNHFIKISKTCEAVVCCRVSPGQKAEVIKLIKQDDLNVISLAIGDGANDVSMIKEAHIGVGLYGNEGLRAV
jgi:magnesium-transporting ATPase (P-type)